MAISMIKIRRPLGRLIFNMGIAIHGKTVFLIETAPCFFVCNCYALMVNTMGPEKKHPVIKYIPKLFVIHIEMKFILLIHSRKICLGKGKVVVHMRSMLTYMVNADDASSVIFRKK